MRIRTAVTTGKFQQTHSSGSEFQLTLNYCRNSFSNKLNKLNASNDHIYEHTMVLNEEQSLKSRVSCCYCFKWGSSARERSKRWCDSKTTLTVDALASLLCAEPPNILSNLSQGFTTALQRLDQPIRAINHNIGSLNRLREPNSTAASNSNCKSTASQLTQKCTLQKLLGDSFVHFSACKHVLNYISLCVIKPLTPKTLIPCICFSLSWFLSNYLGLVRVGEEFC